MHGSWLNRSRVCSNCDSANILRVTRINKDSCQVFKLEIFQGKNKSRKGLFLRWSDIFLVKYEMLREMFKTIYAVNYVESTEKYHANEKHATLFFSSKSNYLVGLP